MTATTPQKHAGLTDVHWEPTDDPTIVSLDFDFNGFGFYAYLDRDAILMLDGVLGEIREHLGES